MRNRPTYIEYNKSGDMYLTNDGDYAGSIVVSWGNEEAPISYRVIPCGASGMFGMTFHSAYAGELYLYACALEAHEMALRSTTVARATGGSLSGAGHVAPRRETGNDGGSLVALASAPVKPRPGGSIADKATAFYAAKSDPGYAWRKEHGE